MLLNNVDLEKEAVLETMSRRDAMKLGLAGILGLSLPMIGTSGEAQAYNNGAWKVNIKHAHTGERFSGVYRVGDKYLPDVFEKLNYMLRDYKTDEAFPMDPRVLDIASMVQAKTRRKDPLQILSAYRCPKTNAAMRARRGGVAKNSFHMYGQALDIRMPGYSTRALREHARGLKAGGVGFYPRSDFIHIDTGQVRSWS